MVIEIRVFKVLKFARPSSFGGSNLGSYCTQEDNFDTVGKVFESTLWLFYSIDYHVKQLQILEEINTKELLKNSRMSSMFYRHTHKNQELDL